MEAPGPAWRAPRRVATTPISLHTRHEASAQSGALVETLYYHPNMRIVSFTASARAFSISPSRRSEGVDKEEAGTLSWSSQLERTIAVGAFRIYRAPASVAFLSCGSALQPILPKSQSWCLDEVNSRFVLQIRRPNYWRLELPVEEAEDQQLAQALRGVLDHVLQFEKTPCPFKRSFTVSLPEPPQEPVKKKPWKPVKRTLPEIGPSRPSSSPLPSETTTQTIPARNRIRDESNYISSSDHSSREASPAPAAATELSAGLPLVRRPRTVPEHIVPVSALVKKIDKRSENETPSTPMTPITPMMAAAAIRTSTPAPDGRAERRMPVPVSPLSSNDGDVAPISSDFSTTVTDKPAELSGQESIEAVTEEAEVVSSPLLQQPATISVDPEQVRVPAYCDQVEAEAAQVPTSPSEVEVETVRANTPSEDAGSKVAQVPAPCNETEPAAVEVPATGDEELTGHELEIHEGAGRQGGHRKIKLRRSMGFASVGRVTPLSRQTSLAAITPSPAPSDPNSESFVSSSDSPAAEPEPPVARPETSVPRSESSAPRPESLAPAFNSEAEDPGEVSSAESEDSFHSVDSWHPDAGLPPSPLASQSESVSREHKQPFDDSSDAASVRTEHTTTTFPDDHVSSSGKQTEAEADASMVDEDERTQPKHRAPASYGSLRRRALSPLPPATLIYSPPAATGRSLVTSNRLGAMRNLPMAIITKTCSMLLGPPLHLVALMLKVAGKIAAGQWRGEEFGYGTNGEQIPVHWDYSDGDLSDSGDEYEHFAAPHSTQQEDD
jgi:hypothetical protein